MEAIADLPMLNDMDADYSPQYVKLARILRDKIEAGQYKHLGPLPALDSPANTGSPCGWHGTRWRCSPPTATSAALALLPPTESLGKPSRDPGIGHGNGAPVHGPGGYSVGRRQVFTASAMVAQWIGLRALACPRAHTVKPSAETAGDGHPSGPWR